ncbi:MAG: arsenite efflux transporter metallochaperone ArsD [Gemmatimonadetes bacterium]|nr:arsenite efflux transporter metallochaperone ArsD [Gemmatimonadota bacterium]MBT8402797.1 arsenite efflux transporter metallochaperone ArsD [Gemmatimonadota bacterium]NNK61714.1 arsenite efflux transporter metallochaperone ArsD [Gemmatimonadota bacterium]
MYDPAMCCSTGVCGSEVDPALVRFAADLDWVEKRGVRVRRYNLAQEPGAFVREPLVRHALQEQGEDALPLIVQGGRVLSHGRYPSREELGTWTRPDR